jgi:hypothetical protein
MSSTTHTAPEAVSFATFKTWLKASQDAAGQGMKSSTGEEFSKHLAAFNLLMDARRVVDLFELQGRA